MESSISGSSERDFLRHLAELLKEAKSTFSALLAGLSVMGLLSAFMVAFPPVVFLYHVGNAHILLSPSLLLMFIAGLFGLRLSIILED